MTFSFAEIFERSEDAAGTTQSLRPASAAPEICGCRPLLGLWPVGPAHGERIPVGVQGLASLVAAIRTLHHRGAMIEMSKGARREVTEYLLNKDQAVADLSRAGWGTICPDYGTRS